MMNMQKTQKYRLAAIDLDETILGPDSNLSDYAAGVLRAMAEKNVKVVVCTGRPYVSSLLYLRRIGLNNPCIFCNGAQIRGALDGKIFHELPLPIEEAKLAIRLGEEAGAHPRVYVDDRICVSHIIEGDTMYSDRTGSTIEAVGDLCAFLDKPPVKIINFVSDPKLVPTLVEKSARAFLDRLYITQSVSINRAIFVEYMNAKASKGKGLRKVADMWGIEKDEIVAAGDSLNDLTMFAEAGLSIAPQNALPSVLEAASVVCLGNAEDGVAKKLAEIFL